MGITKIPVVYLNELQIPFVSNPWPIVILDEKILTNSSFHLVVSKSIPFLQRFDNILKKSFKKHVIISKNAKNQSNNPFPSHYNGILFVGLVA